jgi:hypothetical protein
MQFSELVKMNNYTVLSIININKAYRRNYHDRMIEVRKVGSQVRFYEIKQSTGKEIKCLSHELIKWMIRNNRILKSDNKEFFKLKLA